MNRPPVHRTQTRDYRAGFLVTYFEVCSCGWASPMVPTVGAAKDRSELHRVEATEAEAWAAKLAAQQAAAAMAAMATATVEAADTATDTEERAA